MLNRRIRNATAAASPVNASGVAAISVVDRAPSARNAASNSRRKVVIGSCPVATSSDRDHEERDDERAERHGDHAASAAAAAASRSARSAPLTAACPPAISSPISSTVAVARIDLAHDRALVHDGDPVGQRQHLVEVLADEQHRDAAAPRPRAGTRARSRSRRRRDRASAPRRRARAARPRTRARARPSAGCRRRAAGPACPGPAP